MRNNGNNKKKITPQQAVDILGKHGTKVTLKEAELILEFMYAFAKLSVDQYVKVL